MTALVHQLLNGANADLQAAAAAVAAIRDGRVVLLAEGREAGYGCLIAAADHVSAELLNFLSSNAYGVTSVALADERCVELGLGRYQDPADSLPTTSVSAVGVARPGASAEDRAATIRRIIDPAATRADFVAPGQVFLLRARPGGVLRRAKIAEAAVDVARLAGCTPAALLFLALNPDGATAEGAALAERAAQLGIGLATVDDVLAYRRLNERLVEATAAARLPTRTGDFDAVGFRESFSGVHHLALIKGDVAGAGEVSVSVHAECLTGHVFRSRACDCSEALQRSLEVLGGCDRGVLVYLVRDRWYLGGHSPLAGQPFEGPAPDEYAITAQILRHLGVATVRLATPRPGLTSRLEASGLRVADTPS
jgi:3,4-dihydroxy 2-butanone 4-phosphate synthase / GTP cyclohydrolase II